MNYFFKFCDKIFSMMLHYLKIVQKSRLLNKPDLLQQPKRSATKIKLQPLSSSHGWYRRAPMSVCAQERLTAKWLLLLEQTGMEAHGFLLKGRPHGRTRGYFTSYFCTCTTFLASYTYKKYVCVCVRVRRPPTMLDLENHIKTHPLMEKKQSHGKTKEGS